MSIAIKAVAVRLVGASGEPKVLAFPLGLATLVPLGLIVLTL